MKVYGYGAKYPLPGRGCPRRGRERNDEGFPFLMAVRTKLEAVAVPLQSATLTASPPGKAILAYGIRDLESFAKQIPQLTMDNSPISAGGKIAPGNGDAGPSTRLRLAQDDGLKVEGRFFCMSF